MTQLSVIIPVFNEEQNLPILHQRLLNTCKKISVNFEIIYINDGSKDQSLSIIIDFVEANPQVFYINLSRNFGHQIAVSAGLDFANGDAVVIIDADLQDPPELIEELYATYKQGYQVVYAQRKSRKGESFLKKLTAKYFYLLLKGITQIEIPLNSGDFRLIDKCIVNHLKQMPEKQKFLRGQIAWIGFKQTAVLFEREKRLYGKTNYSYSMMFKLAWDAITGFSNLPLRLVTRIGFAIAILSFFIILFALYSHYVLDRTITGWTSIIISSTFIGGIQLFVFGIIGEYISRINVNVINRPLYIIETTNKN